MKLVQDGSSIYRMSNRDYRKMLKAFADKERLPTWKQLGAKYVGSIDCNTTDMEAEEAKILLDYEARSPQTLHDSCGRPL